MEQLSSEQSEEQTKNAPPNTASKPFHKIISDHKDIIKIIIQLGSIISAYKSQVQEVLSNFSKYSELWTQVKSYFGIFIVWLLLAFGYLKPIISLYRERKYLQKKSFQEFW